MVKGADHHAGQLGETGPPRPFKEISLLLSKEIIMQEGVDSAQEAVDSGQEAVDSGQKGVFGEISSAAIIHPCVAIICNTKAAVLGVPIGLLHVYNKHWCRHKHVHYCCCSRRPLPLFSSLTLRSLAHIPLDCVGQDCLHPFQYHNLSDFSWRNNAGDASCVGQNAAVMEYQ
jgi:hypothetical protein